jgi:mannose-6-phosphate isomerase
MDTTCGGNQISVIPADLSGVHDLPEAPYDYRWLVLEPNDTYSVEGLGSYAILCKRADGGELAIDGDVVLAEGDLVQVENRTVEIQARGSRISAIIVGSVAPVSEQTSMKVTRSADHYRVTKPWGHELWFTGDHPNYCLKEIFITAGNRTSLQYHRRKEETNVVYTGDVRLVYKSEAEVDNDSVTTSHLGKVELPPISVVHIPPGVLHRLEAVSDVLLYEASTPDLDDVIRVQDDTQRRDGRVVSEHDR